MNSLVKMGTIDSIDKTIRGEEHFVEKAKRKEEDDKILKEITDEDKQKDYLKIIYEDIVSILKEYLDLREDYYDLIAIWIIGTYFHKEFESYPYLYINAMRGSGKTRLLKLIAILACNGDLLASMSEAVLFRTAQEKTFCIDEFEGVGKRERANLRELLNAAYKKGTKVKRMKKKRVPDPETGKSTEEQVVEEFDIYCPIALANIWGMEEVLGDRCISLTLEKSDKSAIIKLMENYTNHPKIKQILLLLTSERCSLCSVVSPDKLYLMWNDYVKLHYSSCPETTLTTLTPLTTLTTLTTPNDTFFDKIDSTNIKGRQLELFFPLFIVALSISRKIFENILKIAKNAVKEKRIEEMIESRDVSVIDFISKLEAEEFSPVRELSKKFLEFLDTDEQESKWLNSKWFGRALKRLALIKEKRRVRKGVEVTPNIEKAKKKIKMFKPEENDKPPQS